MDKYTILIILNLPFIIYGLIKATILFKEGDLGRLSFLLRLIFWSTLGFGILFAEELYTLLIENNLTDSTPISLADVVLVTGVSFCFFLCVRLYAKVDHLEQQLTQIQENLSILLSKPKK